ncbi:hypothetical protein FK514_27500, partial [Klebsiella pneumoniae]|nr:hypothetical protein [Klebsiella pneumoniae]
LKIAKAGGPNSVLALARVAQAAGIGLYGGTMLEGTVRPAVNLFTIVAETAGAGGLNIAETFPKGRGP